MDADRKQRVRGLRERCIPEGHMSKAAAIERLLYARIGFLFTRLFVRTRVTPTQITWIWGTLMISFSLMFLFDNPWLHLIGAAGWIIAISMDYTDGQVARYKGMCSKRGVFLDLINHCITWPLLFLCIGLGQYFATGEILNALFGSIAGTLMPLIMLTACIYNVADPGANLQGNDNGVVEGKLLGSEERFRLVKSINPLTFVNAYIIILFAALLDLVFRIELFWMTSFLSICVFIYALGFLVGFLVRAGILYRKLK
jgi:phosphatidylglycerophosphate synthase